MSSNKPLTLLLGLFGVCWTIFSFGASPANAAACTAGCSQYQSAGVFSGSSATITSFAVTTPGDDIHIWTCASGPTAIPSLTFGATNATLGGVIPNTGAYICAFGVVPNVSGTQNVVANYTGTCANCTVIAQEWPHQATSSPIDVANGTYTNAGGASTNLPCGSITVSAGNDLVVTMNLDANGAGASTLPSGYSSSMPATGGMATAYKTAVGNGAINPTYVSAGGGNFVTMCSALKPFSAVAGAPLRSLLGVGQ